jgi:hypothetical protein
LIGAGQGYKQSQDTSHADLRRDILHAASAQRHVQEVGSPAVIARKVHGQVDGEAGMFAWDDGFHRISLVGQDKCSVNRDAGKVPNSRPAPDHRPEEAADGRHDETVLQRDEPTLQA